MKERKGTGPFANMFMKIDPRASKFLGLVKVLTGKHWAGIFAAKRSQSTSFASSDFIEDSLPDYLFVSDSN